MFRTSLERNSRALNVCSCVEGETPSSAANHPRNASISFFPSPEGGVFHEKDKAFDPGDIESFRFEAVVLETDLFSDLIQKLFPGAVLHSFLLISYFLL
jgi:hypothetical protein